MFALTPGRRAVLRDLLLWVGLPVLAAAILAAAAMAMRRSTTVRVDLELSRLGLVVGGDSSNATAATYCCSSARQ